jgi:chemotaxis protein methyltransferase CheR
MLLRESAWQHGSEILGSDVSVPRLATAKRGRYSEWAMRAAPRPLVARYFEQTGKTYLLRREIRAMVEFREINLVSDSALPAHGAAGMDLIFCRNVLIYFSMETVARVAERLLSSLAPNGWLIISSSDPPLSDVVRCETVTTSAGLAYRRADRPGASPAARFTMRWPESEPAGVPPLGAPADPLFPAETVYPLDVLALPGRPLGTPEPPPVRARPPAPLPPVAPGGAQSPASPAPTVESVYASGDFDGAAELATARIAAGHDDERTRVLQVRALANRGRLDDAGAACAAALDQFPLSPELHLLHATLLARAGQFAETVVAARRALYLDPDLVMAHIVGADAMTRVGDLRGAERSLRAAASALARMPADERVAAADGETAGRLQQLVAFHLKALAGDSR